MVCSSTVEQRNHHGQKVLSDQAKRHLYLFNKYYLLHLMTTLSWTYAKNILHIFSYVKHKEKYCFYVFAISTVFLFRNEKANIEGVVLTLPIRIGQANSTNVALFP